MSKSYVIVCCYGRIARFSTISISTNSNIVTGLNTFGRTSTNTNNISYCLGGTASIFYRTLTNTDIIKIVNVICA